RVELFQEQTTQKIRVLVFEQYRRPPIGRIAGPAIGETHEINERQRHREQPDVGGLSPEEQAQIVMTDLEAPVHERKPVLNRRRNRMTATTMRAAPSAASLSEATAQGTCAPA